MDSAIVAAIIAVVGSLFGVWIGSLISRKISRETIVATHINAIELVRINSRKLAGFRLREAFARELSLLQHPEGYSIAGIPHILKTAFEKHHTAVNEFRFFLTGDELDRFNKAWEEYDDYPDFNKYIILPATAEEDIQKVIDRIEAIRKFTEDN